MTGQKTDDRFEIIGHGEILDFLASAWERVSWRTPIS